MTERPAAARLVSLDVFRGATIAAMILVNNPGDWGHVYWPLLHVPWDGWTPTDLIFPFFLFMVGMSLTFSRRLDARPAIARAAKLVGLGLLLALYPYFPVFTVRWPGVLQRIGICYLAAWAAKRWLRPRGQAALAAILLVGYWALMTKATGPEGHPPNLGMETNLSAQVDRILLVPHVWSVTKTWDPEGVLSTFPAIATTILGLLFGEWVRSGRRPFALTLGLLSAGSRSPWPASCGARRRRLGSSSRSTRASGRRPSSCSPAAWPPPCSGSPTGSSTSSAGSAGPHRS